MNYPVYSISSIYSESVLYGMSQQSNNLRDKEKMHCPIK